MTTTWSPGREAGDRRAHRLDHAGGLVAVDGGQRTAPAALPVGDVAVADGAGGDPDRHLAGLRRVEPHLLDRQRRPELAADRSLHVQLSRFTAVDSQRRAAAGKAVAAREFHDGRTPGRASGPPQS